MADLKYSLADDTWGREEIDAINRVIESNRFSMGREVEKAEKAFASHFGSRYAVMVNSGSSANLLAVAAMVYSGKLKKGDEVIVPAVSWSTTYFPLTQHGLKLKFVDICRETLNLDLSQVEEAIGPETKAVFAVNLLGNPLDYNKLNGLCEKHDLFLLEDNCESLGAELDGKQAGTFGLIGTYSSFFSHHICTMEGGFAVTDDLELYHYMLSIRAHGWTRNLPADSPIYTKGKDSFYESFNFIMPGYNLRPLEMEGALAVEQLKKVEGIISQRRENAVIFTEAVKDLEGIRIQKETGKSSWFGFALIVTGPLKGKRDSIVQRLMEAGVEVRPIVAGNFTRNKAVEYMEYSIPGDLSNADEIHDNGFFVGNHSGDLTATLKAFKQILTKSVEEELCGISTC